MRPLAFTNKRHQAYKLRSATAWFWGVLFSIVLNSLKLYNTIEKEKKEVREKKDATSTRAAKRSLIIQYFKYMNSTPSTYLFLGLFQTS
jgi:hypothetical protein